ncbi:MAG: sigma-70 family RNA polymerase sigma factor [Chloroflexota bacterium]
MSLRTNQQWLHDLRATGPDYEDALADLRQILLNGLQRGVLNRINTTAPEFDTQAEDFAQEALLRILDNLDNFAGRSRFTTWAHKIAASVVFTELRRKRWGDPSLNAIMETESGVYTPSFMADPTPTPDKVAERTEILQIVNRLVQEELTDKQRTALVASVIEGQSGAEIAADMKMKANAVYKLIYDARARLKSLLAEKGLSPEEIMTTFE